MRSCAPAPPDAPRRHWADPAEADARGRPRRGAIGGGRRKDPPPGEVLLAWALGRASTSRSWHGAGDQRHRCDPPHQPRTRPLPERAARAVARAARSYTDIEVDRRTGRRGQRGDHAETLLTALTGGEGAMVVNNCAAALLLAMAALAKADR